MPPMDFESLLKQTMGLDTRAIGSSSVQRVLQDRQRSCGLESLEGYWARVQDDERELKALIEAVVVPETWFFRHPEALTAMSRLICHKRSLKATETNRDATEPALLLSLPCSTGEEPYSMAMAMLDAGCNSSRFHIDAVDISEAALAKAKSACYGQNSFRGNSLGFRARYCEAAAEGFSVVNSVREPIRFRQGNLLDLRLPDQLARYDVVFCRNLLIYFDQATQNEAVSVLARLLKKDGLLFVGPAESGLLLKHGWISLGVPHAFGFQPPTSAKVTAPAKLLSGQRPGSQPDDIRAYPPKVLGQTSVIRPLERVVTKMPTAMVGVLPIKPPNTPIKPLNASAKPLSALVEPLNALVEPLSALVKPLSALLADPPHGEQARQHRLLHQAQGLADQGQLEQAERLCQEYLRAYEPVADVFYLLGLVADASNRTPTAEELYRKALYLDPQHLEAMVHLAALLETRSDQAGAARLRDRARRVDEAKRKSQHE